MDRLLGIHTPSSDGLIKRSTEPHHQGRSKTSRALSIVIEWSDLANTLTRSLAHSHTTKRHPSHLQQQYNFVRSFKH
ncbi:hypothetical protein SAMD00019534_046680, partial [Acytostelium subglobosum LB1]|uniref:hypothetical protein n=1 Tax=Acytostelium subglobosum LB1 TaxID=1410327 RepID=UPI0006450A38